MANERLGSIFDHGTDISKEFSEWWGSKEMISSTLKPTEQDLLQCEREKEMERETEDGRTDKN